MIITRHKSRMKGHPDFYCGRSNGAAFFGYSKREVMRKEQLWILENMEALNDCETARVQTKPLLRLVGGTNV